MSSMSSEPDSSSTTESGMALSIAYVKETSLLLSGVRRTILAAAATSTILIVLSILIFGGLSERLERIVPLHEEFIGGLLIVLVIIPLSVYLTHRATSTMEKWRDRLDALSYALRFESRNPDGASPDVRLANQAYNALFERDANSRVNPADFLNKGKGSETFNVMIPGQITKALIGHNGAIVATRIERKLVQARDLSDMVQRVRQLRMRLWRLLIVSDKEFPSETIDYHRSLSKKRLGFSVDLIEQSRTGFSVVALGS
jgi:hypothetical protein